MAAGRVAESLRELAMPITDRLTWDLDSLMPGGFEGPAWAEALPSAEARLSALVTAATALPSEPNGDPAWAAVLSELDALYRDHGHTYAWLHCMGATHAGDSRVLRELGRASDLMSQWQLAMGEVDARVARASEASIEALLAQDGLEDWRPYIEEVRSTAHLLLPPGEQALYTSLSASASGGWAQLYKGLSGRLTVEIDGKTLTPAQTYNLLDAPEEPVRRAALEETNKAWATIEDECAAALSSLTWTRIVANDRLGVDELARPLSTHRLSRESLDAMTDACRQVGPLVQRILRAKARLLGKERLDWWDLRAPVSQSTRTWTWGEAQDFVVEQFASFSQEMADYARHAFESGHVEAEDRGGKRAGAFCIGFRTVEQSRVFMTWGGTTNNLLTLAHELGHAYHNEVMWDLPWARRRVPSTLAETASTFAEALVRGAAMRAARSDGERLALLDEDLTSAVGMLANIPVRVDFDRALYRLRRQGPLSASALCDEMVAIQRGWYGDALGAPDPRFWASKMHFYLTRAFYNYPYTFGYLFSGMVWERASAEGPSWAPAYRELLRDTGAGSCEDVVQRHLGVDLRDPAAWVKATGSLEARVAAFEDLARG